MAATSRVKMSWHGHEAYQDIQQDIMRGVARAAADIATLAAGRAPVGKRKPGRRADRAADVAVQPVRKGSIDTRRGDVRDAMLAIGDAKALDEFDFKVASVYRRKPQKRAGEFVDPSSVFIKRGRLVSGGAHQPGTLKRSIKVLRVETEGHQVKATVAALVKYAAAIEYGFAHKGGRDKKGTVTAIAAKPFLRPAVGEVSYPYSTGKYFKG